MRPSVALVTTNAVLATQAAARPTSDKSSVAIEKHNPVKQTSVHEAPRAAASPTDNAVVVKKSDSDSGDSYDDITVSGCADDCSDNNADDGFCCVM